VTVVAEAKMVGVRDAMAGDVAAIADIQVHAWNAGYRDLLPPATLAEMTGGDAVTLWRERWTEAVAAPPSPRHRVLVAVADGEIVGFAAHAPAAEPDHEAADTAELLSLLVDPGRGREGHGSRLLAATADHLRTDGTVTVVTWLFEDDTPLRALLESAGWAADGARRVVDAGAPLTMVRLHTAL
jgi:GNAT superfamily N-acetyltransferase